MSCGQHSCDAMACADPAPIPWRAPMPCQTSRQRHHEGLRRPRETRGCPTWEAPTPCVPATPWPAPIPSLRRCHVMRVGLHRLHGRDEAMTHNDHTRPAPTSPIASSAPILGHGIGAGHAIGLRPIPSSVGPNSAIWGGPLRAWDLRHTSQWHPQAYPTSPLPPDVVTAHACGIV